MLAESVQGVSPTETPSPLRYPRKTVKVGVALTAAVLIVSSVVLVMAANDPSSTAALAFLIVPFWAIAAICLIWLGVLVASAIRRRSEDRRFARDDGNPS